MDYDIGDPVWGRKGYRGSRTSGTARIREMLPTYSRIDKLEQNDVYSSWTEGPSF